MMALTSPRPSHPAPPRSLDKTVRPPTRSGGGCAGGDSLGGGDTRSSIRQLNSRASTIYLDSELCLVSGTLQCWDVPSPDTTVTPLFRGAGGCPTLCGRHLAFMEHRGLLGCATGDRTGRCALKKLPKSPRPGQARGCASSCGVPRQVRRPRIVFSSRTCVSACGGVCLRVGTRHASTLSRRKR